MDLSAIFDALRAHNWPLLAGLIIFAAVFIFNKTKLSAKVPQKWQWTVPAGLAILGAVASGLVDGSDVLAIVQNAIAGGLAASGLHGWLKNSPLPYGDKPKSEDA